MSRRARHAPHGTVLRCAYRRCCALATVEYELAELGLRLAGGLGAMPSDALCTGPVGLVSAVPRGLIVCNDV